MTGHGFAEVEESATSRVAREIPRREKKWVKLDRHNPVNVRVGSFVRVPEDRPAKGVSGRSVSRET